MTTTQQRSTVVGVFHERRQAQDAIEALKDDGFNPDSISVLSPDKQETADLAEETGTHAGSGAATGAVAGGILGGLGGWLVGIGALAIPGIGPFIAAGAFATALGGAAVGAGVGAIAGALVGMGVPHEEAEYYEGEVKSGRTLVTVRADGRYDDAQQVLRQHGAYDIESRPSAATGGVATATGSSTLPDVAAPASGVGRTSAREADSDTLQLREEELRARKETVQTGEVTIGKEVVEEQRTLEVPTTREEVYVERREVAPRPADRPIGDASEQVIEVPVREERVEVEKRPVVYEEVEVGKQQVVQEQQVSATVRREEARIEQEGNVNLQGAGASSTLPSGAGASGTRMTTWDQAMPGYRTRWQQRVGTTGGRWEDVEPGYRYGWEQRNDPRYQGRSWTDVEPDLQRDWTTRNAQTPWDKVKNSIRETWDDRTPE